MNLRSTFSGAASKALKSIGKFFESFEVTPAALDYKTLEYRDNGNRSRPLTPVQHQYLQKTKYRVSETGSRDNSFE